MKGWHRPQSPLARWSIRQRLTALVVLLIAVIGGIIYLSLGAATDQRTRALVDNIAGRQPVLVHRYLEEVLAVSAGDRADPAETGQMLLATGDALVRGGPVLAVQGNDKQVTIVGATDPSVRAKLTEEARLAHELIAAGTAVLADLPGTPAFRRDVATAIQLANLTANAGHDAVGRMSLLADQAVAANSREQTLLGLTGIVVALAFMLMLSRQIVRRLARVGDAVRARADGDLSRRVDVSGDDEITELAAALNSQADYLDQVQARLISGAERDGFTNQLVEAFEMAEEESDAYDVVQRSMSAIAAAAPMELLLADSSRAHLKRLAVNPTGGAAGCGVESPYSCVAVRRANPVVFDSSTALNACPRLIDRPGGACSAVCVPVSFMGKALGVLHATGPDHQPLGAGEVAQISALASQAGARIGTLRVFQQTQLQASTDGLTGLINRRTLENKARILLLERRSFTLAMADLDHFKILNDTYGHEAGDRALRHFAETLRASLRPDDLICRYGGEEFVLLFPDTTLEHAATLLGQIRTTLADATRGDVPAFTATFGLADTTMATSLEELLRLGDRALYIGKNNGRDQIITSAGADQPHEPGPAPSPTTPGGPAERIPSTPRVGRRTRTNPGVAHARHQSATVTAGQPAAAGVDLDPR